eukprot:m.1122673 g.1122673  ORF g.1122673 m.1122673 type:complete len:136 (+) comp24403_c0_seq8:629-1036(+)
MLDLVKHIPGSNVVIRTRACLPRWGTGNRVSSALSGLFQRLFDTEEDMHKFSEQVHKRSGSVVFWLAGLLGVWKYQRHWIVRSLAFCLVALVTVGQLVNTEKNQGDKKKAVHMVVATFARAFDPLFAPRPEMSLK